MLQHPCNILTQKPFVSRGGLHSQKSVARDKHYYDVIAFRPCEVCLLIEVEAAKLAKDPVYMRLCVQLLQITLFLRHTVLHLGVRRGVPRIDDVESLNRLLSSGGVAIATSSNPLKQLSTTF